MTSLYFVMPVGRIAFHHALIGGVTATVLWEIVRHVLVWYFTSLLLVNLVYGSLATAIVVLLSFEFASLILLFGAQVSAEFERCACRHSAHSVRLHKMIRERTIHYAEAAVDQDEHPVLVLFQSSH